ncbi:hypothetical protein ACFFRR_004682 [Megaselia abdita]
MYYRRDLHVFHRKRWPVVTRLTRSIPENGKSTWRTFWEKTTIHGVRNTSDPSMDTFEKVIWFIIVGVFTSGSIYCFVYYSNEFNSQLTKTVVDDSEYNVFEFHFPSIAICSRNRLNWRNIDEVQKKYIPEAGNETKYTFKKFFGLFDGIRFGRFNNLKDIETLNLSLIEQIHVSKVLDDLSMTCEELLVKKSCFWKSIRYDCCDLFFKEKTEAGVCLVFNSLFSEESLKLSKKDKYYPYSNAKSGEGSGVQVVIQIDSEKKRKSNTDADGVWIMIKNSLEWSHHTIFIRTNTDTSVIITPQVIHSDESIRAVPPSKRKCIFSGEKNFEFYKLENGEEYKRRNCITQCHQWYLHRYCNCTISIFFSQKTLNFRECTPQDFNCVYKNRELFSNDFQPSQEKYIKSTGDGMMCPCLRNCDSVNYLPSFNSLSLQK